MPRRARQLRPNATYHVMMRGNHKHPIFHSDAERYRFLQLMEEGVGCYDHEIFAYCLMTNHVHLAIKANSVPLSNVIHNLSFRYTQYFHYKRDTCGHLFQGRFTSKIVDSDGYFGALLRYISLNPVRANMVSRPEDYRWSSYRAYIGLEEASWLSRDDGLRIFGESAVERVETFRDFIMGGVGREESYDFETGLEVSSLARLLEAVESCYGLDHEALLRNEGSRLSTHVTSVIAVTVRNIGGITLDEVCELLGKKLTTLQQAATRLQGRMRSDSALSSEVQEFRRNVVFGDCPQIRH